MHQRLFRPSVLAALAFLVLVGSQPAMAQGTYTINDLGLLHPDDAFSQAFGVNTYGQVSGFVLTIRAEVRAFLWTPDLPHGTTGSMIDLGPAITGVGGGFKVNDYGQVLLNADVQTAFGIQSQAFLWTPDVPNGTTGTRASLGGPTGADGVSSGYGLNNLGQVTGFAYPGVCFLWTPDTPNGPTGSFNSYFNGTDNEPGFGYSSHGGDAFAVNDSGQVTGDTLVGFFQFPIIHGDAGFHYVPADIISPSYDPNSRDFSGSGLAINAAGDVAGSVDFPNTSEIHPFLYDGTTMIDIGPGGTAIAYGINAQDQVVGSGNNQAFLYSAGTTAHLMDLIDPGTGWIQLRDAWAINDSGQIVGSGVTNGQLHAFLMTPR